MHEVGVDLDAAPAGLAGGGGAEPGGRTYRTLRRSSSSGCSRLRAKRSRKAAGAKVLSPSTIPHPC
jgi:hypothetical protein